jgi:hypothetical protein
MPVSFLTPAQRQNFGRYVGTPSADDLARYFHLDDTDLALIAEKRGVHNRLGFALQLTTVRFLGTFLENPLEAPTAVLSFLSRQLAIPLPDSLGAYPEGRQRLLHATEIRIRYGYRDFADRDVGFRLARWLYGLCWTGAERPGLLFERATHWLLSYKVLLPGASVLERFVAKVRRRVEARLWRLLGQGITAEQKVQLDHLLSVPTGSRASPLDQLRSGPVTASGPSLVRALQRVKTVRDLGLAKPVAAALPPSRLALLARFAASAKATVIKRLPPARRLATLVASVQSLEATARDDALEVLEIVLHDLFAEAVRADRQARLRTLKDLDQAALTLAATCALALDESVPEAELRSRMLARTPRETLEQAVNQVQALTRPPNDVYFRELDDHYRSVRRYLPTLLKHLRLDASPAGVPVVAALDWLRANAHRAKPSGKAPREVISKAWEPHVVEAGDRVNLRAYTLGDSAQTEKNSHRHSIGPFFQVSEPNSRREWPVRAGKFSGNRGQADGIGHPLVREIELAMQVEVLPGRHRALAERLDHFRPARRVGLRREHP